MDKIKVKDFINSLKKKRTDIKSLIDEIGSNPSYAEERIILKQGSFYNTCVIDFANKEVQAITFYGNVNITINDLVEIYGNYSQKFVPHDDIYDFYFNQDKSEGNFIIRIFFDRQLIERSLEDFNKRTIKNLQLLFV